MGKIRREERERGRSGMEAFPAEGERDSAADLAWWYGVMDRLSVA